MEPLIISSKNIAKWFENPQVTSSLKREYQLLDHIYDHDLPEDLGERVDAIAQGAIPSASLGSEAITPPIERVYQGPIVVDFTSNDGEKLFSIPIEKLHYFPQLLESIRIFETHTLHHFKTKTGTFPPLEIVQEFKEIKDQSLDIDFSKLQQAIDAICSDEPGKWKTDNAQENLKFAALVCVLLQYFETPPDICPRLCVVATAALESPYFETDSSQPLYSGALLSFASLSPAFEKAASRLIHKYLKSFSSPQTLLEPALSAFRADKHPNFQEVEHISLLDPTEAELAEIKNYFPNVKSLEIKFTSRMCKEERNEALRELNRLAPVVTSLDLSDCFGITDTELAYLKDLPITSLDLSDSWITGAGIADFIKTHPGLASLNLSRCTQITDADLACLEGLPTLTSLTLAGCDKITDAAVASLASLFNLTTLDLSDSWITGAGIADFIKAHPSLASLNLSRCTQITDTKLACFEGITTLTSLTLAGCDKITDAGVASLASLSDLTTLDLSQCKKITDAAVASLASFENLTTLYLSQCDKITDAGVASLASLSRLIHLGLGGCWQITDTGAASLASLSYLTYLDLGGCAQITDAGVTPLASLSRLTALYLSKCNITNAGVASLASLTRLTRLDLGGCWQITDAGIAHLNGLTTLTWLRLSECNITNAGIAHLASLVGLTTLYLRGCWQITDAGIAHLASLIGLTKLYLSKCNITDAAVASLAFLSHLTHLDLSNCQEITSVGIALLKDFPALIKLYLQESNITEAEVDALIRELAQRGKYIDIVHW